MDISQMFCPVGDTFTIYVVENSFAMNRGYNYLHSFINTSNFVTSDDQIKKTFSRVIANIEKNVAPVSSLLSLFTSDFPIVSITEAITALCKLFTVHEHHAAGPDILDPIILQEGKITKHMLTRLINLHKDSYVAPSIIIILKDNDFDRAKSLLSECPNGINIKMIRNNEEEIVYKVINCGAENITDFIDAFSEQCYSTCANTKRDILLNTEWSNDPFVSKYSPILFKIRTSLLYDQKDKVKKDLMDIISQLAAEKTASERDGDIQKSILCMARLFLVFCNDAGGKDIVSSYRIAKDLNNQVLLAHIYRYAEFLPNCSEDEKNVLYDKGYDIFKHNRMLDHAIYCRNNKLIQQFYSENVFPEEFRDMQQEAVNSVPGMVGLSHIYNNVGVAYLYCGDPYNSIEFFDKGLDYAKYQDRIVQKLAIKSNKMIAQSYSFSTVSEQEIYLLLRQIFDGMGLSRLPFLTADYVLNVLSVAFRQNAKLGENLLNYFPIKKLVENSFTSNLMGSGERILQMQYLEAHYREHFPLLHICSLPKKSVLTIPTGRKKNFITQYGFNLFEFNTWL